MIVNSSLKYLDWQQLILFQVWEYLISYLMFIFDVDASTISFRCSFVDKITLKIFSYAKDIKFITIC